MNNKSRSFRLTLRGKSVGCDRRGGKGYLCKFTWGSTSSLIIKLIISTTDLIEKTPINSRLDQFSNYTSWMTLLAFYQWKLTRRGSKTRAKMAVIREGNFRGRASLQIDWKGAFSRHFAINFSSASGFEADGGRGRPVAGQIESFYTNLGPRSQKTEKTRGGGS